MSIAGSLEDVPKLDAGPPLETIYRESTELRGAEVLVRQTEYSVRRAENERIPDIICLMGFETTVSGERWVRLDPRAGAGWRVASLSVSRPRASDMSPANFRKMAGAYPLARIKQRNLFQLQHEYAAAQVVA